MTLTLTPAPAAAQGVSTSAVRGQVATAEGLPLSDVTVVVVHEPSGTRSTDVTDSEGRYYVPNLRPGGPYTLEASRLGFASSHREGLTLPLGQALDVDVVLSEAAVEVPEIAVEVEQDPVFNPARMGSMTLVDTATVASVPNIRRDLLRYADLSPLASVTDDGVSVAGQNPRFNALQIDGALSQDVFGSSSSGVVGGRAGARALPLEAVEQFQVLTAPYDVRHAGFTGGVLNAVTKSGTNEWTGTFFGNWRDEALVGDLVVDEVARAPDQLDKVHLGIAGGGPLVEDRLHLYAAGEFERGRQPPTGLEVGVDGPLRTGVPVDSAAEMVSLLEGRGFDPGTLGSTTLENRIGNAFLRLDADPGGGHRGVFRYHYAGATDEPPPNRLPGEPYDFSSHGSEVETNSHSAVLQLLSDLGSGVSNDLLVNFQFVREEVRPVTEDPRVEVELAGIHDDFALSRRVRAGAPLEAHLDEVDQDVLQIEDNLTVSAGDHRLLVGAGLQRFGISRRFLPQSRGSYHFRPFGLGDQHVGGLDALRRDQPIRYEIGLLRDGVEDAEVGFPVWQFAGWLQDTWRPAERLNLRAGLRVDVPTIPETPPPNGALEEELGVRTDQVPSGNPLVSPRLGLNWQPFESGATQLRVGAGLFTGRPPLVWLAHAYEDTGLRTFVLACEGIGVAPGLDPGTPPPEECADGSRPEAGGGPSVVFFDPDFRFPQELKASVGIDQRLPGGIVASGEFLTTRAIHQVALQNVNLREPVESVHPDSGYSIGYGFGGRETYGIPTATGFDPGRVSEEFGPVIRVTNDDRNFAWAASLELRKRFGDRFGLTAGYAHNRTGDTQSLLTSDVVANHGLNPVEGDPNRPQVRPALFDRPHKVVLSAWGRFFEDLGGTRVGLFYVGQSGRPYSYVYAGDVNGDGLPGEGRARERFNDLIYVPDDVVDSPSMSLGSLFAFHSLIGLDDCLTRAQASVLARNACRSPWSNRLDLRVTQEMALGGTGIEVNLDVLNLLNALDSDWGRVETTTRAVQVLALDGRGDPAGLEGKGANPLVSNYRGPIRTTEEGSFAAELPHVPGVPDSQWQAQLGVRVSW